MKPKTEEFMKEYYPSFLKERLAYYLKFNMDGIEENDNDAEMWKESFKINLDKIKEIAGTNIGDVKKIEEIYESMGRTFPITDEGITKRNEIKSLIESIKETAKEETDKYGIKDREEKLPKENIKEYENDEHSNNREKENNETELLKNQKTYLYKDDMDRTDSTEIYKSDVTIDNEKREKYRQAIEKNLYEKENKEDEKLLAVIPERKGFINWVKEKFNNIKGFFSKNKTNDIELDETGQAWQDYIDEQEKNNTGTNKKTSFINSITMNNKLKNKEQQKKAFEAVRKWEEQNKKEIEQGTDDREP